MSIGTEDTDGFSVDMVAGMTKVSRETLERLQAFLAELDVWRFRLNLIGPAEAGRIWRRHVLDSLQLVSLVPDDVVDIADLGSGSGFPGMMLACAFADRPGFRIRLVESSPKKCTFLRSAALACNLPVDVINARLETGTDRPAQLITARALARLPKLLDLGAPWLRPDGRALFLKGRSAEEELTEARECWTFDAVCEPSRSDADGRVLALSNIRRSG